jgi:aspartyl-tRNA(Asn)/glutamyl-tRNA(Gln) amidotransferase subunit A
MIQQSPERYDQRTLFRLKNCAGISATDYIRERRRLTEFRAKAEGVFQEVDVIITPTTPVPAPKLADLEALAIPEVRPFEVKYLLRNTAPFSVLFWPTMSVPCGFTSEGLPVGVQISARPGADSTVLRVAHAYEQATMWHERLIG